MYASATKQKKQIKAMAIVPFFSKFANKSVNPQGKSL